MPESKHHKKNRSHSAWRKTRNIRRAQAKNEKAQERRGMQRAMELMGSQFQAEQQALGESKKE